MTILDNLLDILWIFQIFDLVWVLLDLVCKLVFSVLRILLDFFSIGFWIFKLLNFFGFFLDFYCGSVKGNKVTTKRYQGKKKVLVEGQSCIF